MEKKSLPAEHLPSSTRHIEHRTYSIRGYSVMLDRDLAGLYGAKAITVRQQVKRNHQRFPEDFMFQLTAAEADLLVLQNVIPWRRRLGGSLPYAFAQEGAAMLSAVLHSERVVQVNIATMRAFVLRRRLADIHKDLAGKIAAIKKKYDARFGVTRAIGFIYPLPTKAK
jgi:hypothetical protein